MIRYLSAAAFSLVPLAAMGQTPALPEGCTLLDQSEIISVLLCEGEFEEAVLVEAGKAACGDRLPCGAWFWRSAADAPASAPANHDGLTQPEVVSSLGVWVAEDQLFISIEAMRN
jgi:hypothetical protein